MVKIYLIRSIEHIHGGLGPISRHFGSPRSPKLLMSLTTAGRKQALARHNYMTDSKLARFSRRVEERRLIQSRGWVSRQRWGLSCRRVSRSETLPFPDPAASVRQARTDLRDNGCVGLRSPLTRSLVFGDYLFFEDLKPRLCGATARSHRRRPHSPPRKLHRALRVAHPPIRRAHQSAPCIRTRSRSGG